MSAGYKLCKHGSVSGRVFCVTNINHVELQKGDASCCKFAAHPE